MHFVVATGAQADKITVSKCEGWIIFQVDDVVHCLGFLNPAVPFAFLASISITSKDCFAFDLPRSGFVERFQIH